MDFERVASELPELRSLESEQTARRVAAVWASFLDDGSYERIADAPALPGAVLPSYDLATHTRHVVRNCEAVADTLSDFAGIDCDRDALLAAALAHDASKLVEYEPDGSLTETGGALLHAQLAGVRCLEAGLGPKVAYVVTYHPMTPPHVHLTPRHIELVLLAWADLAAVDPVFFSHGAPTHLDIAKRFFSLD